MAILLTATLITSPALADGAFSVLEKKAETIHSNNSKNGWAYLISGGVLLGASIPGYYLSDDAFAQGVYSIGETLGVVAIGYGSYLVLVDDEYVRFVRILRSSPTLTHEQRDHLASLYLRETADRARAARKIRVITHSLTAGLNFLSAATTSNADLQLALYFLGGINTLAALSFGFTSSEEEKLAEGQRVSAVATEWLLGPVSGGGALAGVRLHF